MEDIKEFADIEQVSTNPLRFAEWYLSSEKSDSAHNSFVSLNNCMLRISGTYNSKNNTMVKIIKKWDNHRPKITLLLGSFCAYLKDTKLKQQRLLQQNLVAISTSTSLLPKIFPGSIDYYRHPSQMATSTELTGLTTGAITGVIDRLEKAGYVRRKNDPEDRRRTIVESVLNKKLERRLEMIFVPLHEKMYNLLSSYSDR